MAQDSAEFTVELVDEVSGPAKSAARGVDHLGRSLGGLDRSAGGLRSVLAVAGGNLLAMAGSKLIELGASAVSAGVDLLNFAQQSRLAFQLLAKGGDTPDKLFRQASSLAVRFGLDLQETTNTFRDFLKLGFTSGQSELLVSLGADLRALGTSQSQLSSIFNAMGKIKAQGKLQGDELMMLAEAGVDLDRVYGSLGKRLGVSRDAVMKLQAAGELLAGPALGAITDAIMGTVGETKAGDIGQKFADGTITGIVARLKTKGTLAISEVFAGVAPLVTAALGPLAARLEEFGGGFMAGFRSAWPAVQKALGWISGTFGPGGPGALAGMNAAEFGAALGKIAAVAVGALGVLVQLGAAVLDIASVFVTAGQRIGAALWDGFLGGLLGRLGSVVAQVGEAFSSVVARAKGVLGIASPSKVFEDIGVNVGLGFNQGVEAEVPSVGSLADGMRTATAAPMVGGGGAMTFAPTITVNFGAADAPRDAQGVADRVRAEVERIFLDFTEGAALAAGV